MKRDIIIFITTWLVVFIIALPFFLIKPINDDWVPAEYNFMAKLYVFVFLSISWYLLFKQIHKILNNLF